MDHRYTRSEVQRMIGISRRELDYWTRLRLVLPRARWGPGGCAAEADAKTGGACASTRFRPYGAERCAVKAGVSALPKTD